MKKPLIKFGSKLYQGLNRHEFNLPSSHVDSVLVKRMVTIKIFYLLSAFPVTGDLGIWMEGSSEFN